MLIADPTQKNAPDADQGVEGNRINPLQRSNSVLRLVHSAPVYIVPRLSLQCDMASPAGVRCVATATHTATVHTWPCAMKPVTLCDDCLSYYLVAYLPEICSGCGQYLEKRSDIVSNVVALVGAK